MLECVSGKDGVVDLDVYLEVLVKSVCPEKSYHCLRVCVILVLHGLHRLRLHEEVAPEAFGPGVVPCHPEHCGKVLFLTFHVGVEEGHVAFAASPEHIVLTSELDGGVNGILYLEHGPCCGMEVRIGDGPVHVSRMLEYIRRAPQQPDACLSLLLFRVCHDFTHVLLILFGRVSFFYKVHIVEAIVFKSDFLHDFKSCIHLGLCSLKGSGTFIPWKFLRPGAELV